MTITATGTLVGRVDTEAAYSEGTDDIGKFKPAWYTRPVDTPLQNDGYWAHWMSDGEEYVLRCDGSTWQVSCWSWPTWDGHVFRLANPAGLFVDVLPVAGVPVRLSPAHTYVLRSVGEGHFDLYQL